MALVLPRVKFFWTFLMALALLAGQFAAVANPALAQSACCVQCSCAQFDCCSSGSTPAPVAPPTSSQVESRVQLAVAIVNVLAVAAPAQNFVESSSLSQTRLAGFAVPLYSRHCIYLI